MDLGGLIAILIIIVCISLWTMSFIQLNKFGGKKGIRQFFIMLIVMVALSLAMYIIFVVPTMQCTGFLCGLEGALYFLIGCLTLLVLFPVIMLTVHVRLLKRRQEKTKH